jgi:hypothetical protein
MKIDLYRLLPSVYRNRDIQFGEPLRALLGVLGEEIDAVRQDVDRLYDGWFIESCDEWIVPYIGDLLGVEGLHPGQPEVFSLRAFVANTLAYRRRKGTSSVLENIAQDVSGWSVSGVEFFQLLTTTQHPDHVRLTTLWSTDPTEYDRIGTVGTIDVRQIPLLARLGTAFDTASRTIDIRPFSRYDGWHNVDRLGIFIWRLRSFPMREAPLLHVEDGVVPDLLAFQSFCLHPLGLAFPLFARPVRQLGATERRREWEVPQPIERTAFNADIERYYGDEKSLLIVVDGEPITAAKVTAADLDGKRADVVNFLLGNVSRTERRAFVDVESGRLILAHGNPAAPEAFVDPDSVRMTYHYGFSANIGGGPYGRTTTNLVDTREIIRVAKCAEIDTLEKALAQRTGTCTVIRFMDSGIYEQGFLNLSLANGETLVIEAADGMRPTLKGQWLIEALDDEDESPPVSGLRLSGLLIKADLHAEGSIHIEIDHCTLVSDFARAKSHAVLHVPSLSFFLEIDIRQSMVGALRINEGIKQLRIRDSIVDARLGIGSTQDTGADLPIIAIQGKAEGTPGPEIVIERSTILGDVHVRAMPLASESIFTGRVTVVRKQEGCMRYCYVNASLEPGEDLEHLSRTPRRFRCQPDLAMLAAGSLEPNAETQKRIREQIAPVFCATSYGHPSYARLASHCPEEIRKGAENGSEMGAFSHLREPQREANVREAVRRYLPFGLEMNIIYADEETNS